MGPIWQIQVSLSNIGPIRQILVPFGKYRSHLANMGSIRQKWVFIITLSLLSLLFLLILALLLLSSSLLIISRKCLLHWHLGHDTSSWIPNQVPARPSSQVPNQAPSTDYSPWLQTKPLGLKPNSWPEPSSLPQTKPQVSNGATGPETRPYTSNRTPICTHRLNYLQSCSALIAT